MIESNQPATPGYANLPEECFARVAPTPVGGPRLLRLNRPLAAELRLSAEWLESAAGTEILSGNQPFDGIDPLAMAYGGHQFGNWVPSLGDGRAVLIGEARDRDGAPREIQLKGAGRTPFSRGGDGRAALGPVLREYVLSEAMHALGIPTTRALAMLVSTGEPVYMRERAVARRDPDPGRLGEHICGSGCSNTTTAREMQVRARHRQLADFVNLAPTTTPSLLKKSRIATCALLPRRDRRAGKAQLVAQWMLVGFIHGVMNTDNMSVMGETIDYGPCAFLDEYEPGKVFSSIDTVGRYAYDQQPSVGLWNLTRFAETLLPLFSEDADAAVEQAKESLGAYSGRFEAHYRDGILRKVGLEEPSDTNLEVASRFLELMAEGRADFTLSFRGLCELPLDAADGEEPAIRATFADPERFDAWAADWRQRLRAEARDDGERRAAMRATNPAFIPRNHRVQQAIEAATEGDLGPLDDLIAVTTRPFDDHPALADHANPPEPNERVHRTFCGT